MSNERKDEDKFLWDGQDYLDELEAKQIAEHDAERRKLFDAFAEAQAMLFALQMQLPLDRRPELYRIRLLLANIENAEISKDERARLILRGKVT